VNLAGCCIRLDVWRTSVDIDEPPALVWLEMAASKTLASSLASGLPNNW
jgi:hypothetical protein